MSRTLNYVFPIANTSDVCALQSTAGAGNLNLNGNLGNQSNGQVSFLNHGYSRHISITSANNLAAITFTVMGIQNGVFITENITGPNATTVYGTLIYDAIASISVNGATNAVSVGTGYRGFFPLININLEKSVINYSLSTETLTPGTSIQTTIYNTNDTIFQNGTTYLNTVTTTSSLFTIKASSTDTNLFLPAANVVLCNSILIYINGMVGQIANSIRMIFIQS